MNVEQTVARRLLVKAIVASHQSNLSMTIYNLQTSNGGDLKLLLAYNFYSLSPLRDVLMELLKEVQVSCVT